MPRIELNIAEHVDRVRNPNAHVEEIRSAAAAAIGEIDRAVGELQGRAGELAEHQELLPTVARILEGVTQTRQAIAEALVKNEEPHRAVADVEVAVRNWVKGDIDQGRRELQAPLQEFDISRRTHREQVNRPLKELADLVLALQRDIVASFDASRKGALTSLVSPAQRADIVARIMRVAQMYTLTINQDDVDRYIFLGDASAKTRISEQGRENTEGANVLLPLLDDVHRLVEQYPQFIAARPTIVGHLIAKAACADDIQLPEQGWVKAMKTQYRGTSFDLYTNAGTQALVYIDGEGNMHSLRATLPASYDGLKLSDALAKEDDPSELRIPTSGLVFAHGYGEQEVIAAISALPEGAQMRCEVLAGNRLENVTLTKSGTQLVYEGTAPAGAPTSDKLMQNPGRYINPRTLTFIIANHGGGRSAT